ncbi:hypothetical protein [Paenibacillus amylolyticus]|nr:hypothetical protein [Paenibacillus amylolyticus]
MKEELMKKSIDELKQILKKDMEQTQIKFPVLEFYRMKENHESL